MKTVWAYVKLAIGIILIGIVLIFTAQNAGATQVRFLGWSLESSLSLLMFLVLAVGVVSGFLMSAWFHWRRAKRKRDEPGFAAEA